MAVDPDLPGLRAEIHSVSDEKQFPEYDIDTADISNDEHSGDDQQDRRPRKKRRRSESLSTRPPVTKYIEIPESETTPFKICCKFSPDRRTREYFGYDLRAKIYLDGRYMTSRNFSKQWFTEDDATEGWYLFLAGVRIKEANSDRRSESAFQFSALNVDSESPENPSKAELERSKRLGVIKIEMYRVHLHPAGRINRPGNEKALAGMNEKVKEKLMKGRAISHAISLKPPQEIKPAEGGYYKHEYVDSRTHPCAAFIFHYRTLENLKKLGIVDRTPSPIPLEEVPFDSLTAEQKDVLVRRYQIEYAKRKRSPSPI